MRMFRLFSLLVFWVISASLCLAQDQGVFTLSFLGENEYQVSRDGEIVATFDLTEGHITSDIERISGVEGLIEYPNLFVLVGASTGAAPDAYMLTPDGSTIQVWFVSAVYDTDKCLVGFTRGWNDQPEEAEISGDWYYLANIEGSLQGKC